MAADDTEFAKSAEALFHDSHLEILIPNVVEDSDPVSLLKAVPREYAFFGTRDPFSREFWPLRVLA